MKYVPFLRTWASAALLAALIGASSTTNAQPAAGSVGIEPGISHGLGDLQDDGTPQDDGPAVEFNFAGSFCIWDPFCPVVSAGVTGGQNFGFREKLGLQFPLDLPALVGIQESGFFLVPRITLNLTQIQDDNWNYPIDGEVEAGGGFNYIAYNRLQFGASAAYRRTFAAEKEELVVNGTFGYAFY